MKKYNLILSIVLLILVSIASFALDSTCIKYPAKEVRGTGPLPYNYRIIDGHVHAGGHPLNPNKFKNSDKETLSILNHLKSQGVTVVINLENTKSIYNRYKKVEVCVLA